MQRPATEKCWAVVLAGGDGIRLQELTRQITGSPIPKQYCRIMGKRSMLETTLLRTQFYAPLDRTVVVLNADHLEVAREQLRPLPAEHVLVQPCNRDTGPGLLFALLGVARRDASATVAVFPSDHYVGEDRAFIDHVAHASQVVRQVPDKIVLLGIQPDHPETSYGYIVPASVPAHVSGERVTYQVECFHEKPPVHVAQGLLNRGGLWNSFVMVFQIARMLELLRQLLPLDYECIGAAQSDPVALREAYRHLRPWNFSHDFLMRIPQHLAVVPVSDVYWSDWGTRDLIERTLNRLTQRAPWQTSQPPMTAVAS